MKRLLRAALALCLSASMADARALVVRVPSYAANGEVGTNSVMSTLLPMLNTLGGDYRVVRAEEAPQGATDALRRGTWFYGGSVNSDSARFDPIIFVGDDTRSAYTGNTFGGDIGREASVSGYGRLHSAGKEFAYWKPGFLVTGTGITGTAVVVSVDSSGGVARLAGTIAGSAVVTDVTWRLPLRGDSLTFTAKYPKVTLIRIGNMFSGAAFRTQANFCSTGVGGASNDIPSYAVADDSTKNVYEVGNPYRSWKSRVRVPVTTTRDTRGWRPLLGCVTTRQNNAGYAGGNYDFPDPACVSAITGLPCAFSTNPDTVVVWAVMNWGAAGTPIGGDAKPNVYCYPSHLNSGTAIDPGILLTTLAWGDSLSGGGLFGNSTKLPRRFGIHIDDAWRRGDSKWSTFYGMISTDDTTTYKASIDSLAALGAKLVVSYEPESLSRVLLAAGVTGNGRFYDQRWWARAPLVHYTPHCHTGTSVNVTPAQNIFGEVGAGFTGKNLRVLDIFGVSRLRYAFGSVDSMLAYGLPDYVNDPADSGSVYWLVKRAFALGDSVFGASKVDRLIMPAGDDWSITNVRHRLSQQQALGVDSVAAALLAAGAVGVRTNNNNVVGQSDSVAAGSFHNNYGYYPGWKRIALAQSSGGPGMPTWLPASLYGRTFEILPTNGYPSGDFASEQSGSINSWSQNRLSYGGEAFLRGLLCETAVALGGEPGGQRAIFILTSHTGDYGSSGVTGEATRPQFYTTKYVLNAIRTANAHARRALVENVYPQEVIP